MLVIYFCAVKSFNVYPSVTVRSRFNLILSCSSNIIDEPKINNCYPFRYPRSEATTLLEDQIQYPQTRYLSNELIDDVDDVVQIDEVQPKSARPLSKRERRLRRQKLFLMSTWLDDLLPDPSQGKSWMLNMVLDFIKILTRATIVLVTLGNVLPTPRMIRICDEWNI